MPETEREACRRLAKRYHADVEVCLPDGSRCDLLSPDHAWEVDWAHKWHEAIGQTVLYASWTGRKPGIILLVRSLDDDKPDILRALVCCTILGIDVRCEPSPE